MPSTTKFGSIEAIFLVLTVMINHLILNLPKHILNATGSASLVNIIFISMVLLVIVYFICKLFKRFPGLDILDISQFLGGKPLKYIIGVLFILYFLITSSIFLRSFCESLKIIYFPRTPVLFLILLFVISIVIVNKLGNNAFIRANTLILPLVLLSIVFIFIFNMDNFTVQRMFPLFGQGISTTFFSGMSNLFAFSGIAYLYFLPPSLNNVKQFPKIAFTSMILSAIWLFFSVATLLFIFPSIVTTDEILPLYFASRFIQFGRFFQRLDAIFLLIWIVSIVSYLSITMSISINIFKKLSDFKYIYIIIYGFGLLLFILSLLPQNSAQIYFLEYHFHKYFVFGIVYIISLTILIFANLKYKKHVRTKGEILLE